ncbi:hypothetical protein HO173_001566 [Letharia columbiana]|uniref:Arf-GAP domain-containing protein n=1 Tax=Letharia columbiana TaxID=112416 RepID=A0A8H6G3N7_9LECA|nr:uncharacterized protein HO173_001566 [Letharia columbiana]KAF6239958.1 hypothetical protein HO173_001566 [Letharia columbiana]
MSRRAPPNPAAERAAQNQQTIKTLLKLEGNKSCADCKRNKHPRWASWNLGVFVCIRCSGIHRGMGTHISRVKSVDLDAWTDEQLQSVLRWGNSRANKYWEAKLAAGHVPSDGKIENFIRTKYESKRWVMDGPMPDPATLDAEGDDDVPLNLVKEKAQLERGASQRAASTSSQPVIPAPKAAPPVDLFGDVPEPPVRPNTTDVPGRSAPPKASAPPKQAKAADSLLGLDFFGGPPSATSGRPSSSASTPSGSAVPSRPDLKQSILSLYASVPKTQPPPQPQRQPSFGGMQSPAAQQQSSFGGLDDAFSGLNFNPPTSTPAPKPQQQPKSDPFASFNNAATQRSSVAAPQVTSPPLGGGFFDTGPKLASKPANASKPPQLPQANLTPSASNDFGDFSFASPPAPASTKPATTSTSNDLFDFSEPTPPRAAPKKAQAPVPASPPSANINSAFNLSAPAAPSQPTPKPAASAPPANTNAFSSFSNSTDAWGSSDAWATPEPSAATTAPKPQPAAPARNPSIPMSTDFSAWGGTPASSIAQSSALGSGFGSTSRPTPKVAPDEDFGGWSSAAPATPAASNPPPVQNKPAGGGGFGGASEDLFSNVWE